MTDEPRERDEELVAKLVGRQFLSALELDEIATLISDIPSRLRRAVAADRTTLWKEIDVALNPIVTALKEAPYRIANPGLAAVDAVLAIISDPLGDHMGTCELCEEPVFVQGTPDDDCESGPEEGSYAHRTCMDLLRKQRPELFRNVEGQDGEEEVDDGERDDAE